MRENGHIGIGLPVSGDQESRRAGRPARRRATGPRPVRPPVLQASPRPDAVPAVRRPVGWCDGGAGSSGVDPGGVERRGGGFGACAPVDVNGAIGGAGVLDAADAVGRTRAVGAAGAARGASASALDGALVTGAGGGAGGGRTLGAARADDGASAGGAVRARGAAGARVLVRRLQAPAPRRGDRVRRVMAGLALVLAAAAVVVGLGRVADLTAQARGAAAPGVSQAAEVTVTVTAPGTVWDVADGVAPDASGPQRAALADRIVVANSLTSVRVLPGQVLRVPL